MNQPCEDKIEVKATMMAVAREIPKTEDAESAEDKATAILAATIGIFSGGECA